MAASPSTPLVSAIMAAYNYERYVAEALESALAQDYPADRLELIVIDDGSTDGTPEIARRYAAESGGRIRYVRQDNAGLAAATTRGLREARGELITLLDADDAWVTPRTRLLVDALARNPNAGLVYGDTEVIDEHGGRLAKSWLEDAAQPPYRGHVAAHFLRSNFVMAPSLMARATLLHRFCPIPPWFPAQDWYIAARVAEVAEIDFVPAVVARYRRHGANMSHGRNSPSDVAALLHRDAGVRRWMLANLRAPYLTAEDLNEAYSYFSQTLLYAARVKGVAPEALIDVSEHDRCAAGFEIRAGRSALATGDFPGAAGHFVAALAADPFDRLARDGLGHAVLEDKLARGEDAFANGDLVTARRLLLDCAQDPVATPVERAQALNDLGVIATHGEQLGETEAFLLQALATVPDYVPALENLGGLCALRGDLVQATHWCRRVIELTPDDADARRRLADILQQRLRSNETSAALTRVAPAMNDSQSAVHEVERVLIVTDWFYPSVGGTERLAEAVGVALQREGMAVDVAARPMAERTSHRHRGMAIHEMHGSDYLDALTALVRDQGYDAIVAFSNTVVWPIVCTLQLPAPRPRIVVVPCVNAVDTARLQANPDAMQVYARLVAGADVLGYSSRTGYDVRLWDELGLGGVYLPNAIERVPAGPPPTALATSDAPLLLVVANFWPEKNHLGLLRALRNHSGDFQLALIGAPSPEHPHLAEAVARFASEDSRVRLLGPCTSEAVAAAMDAADALLLASLAEATPLVLLEAMSRRLPWIATPTCGAAHDHAGGMILPLELFGHGIDFLLANPKAASTLGAAGADHWRACYTWDVIGPRYASVLRGQPVSDLQAPPAALDDTDAVRAQFYDGRVGQEVVSLADAA